MDIIIAGAGRVGYRLAMTLSLKHNVYIIDKNKEALRRLGEQIDIMPINGDIENPDTYKALLEKNFNLFIAVTDNDEVNILSTLIADDIIEVDKKIIRLRNPFFAKSSIAQKLGINDAVFPFIASANSVKALFDFPKAHNVKKFIFTPLKLISLKAQSSKIASYDAINSKDVVVIGYEREKKLHFPTNEPIKEEDLIYLFGHPEAIKKICSQIDTQTPTQIKNVAIFGAKLLGLEIAKALIDGKYNIKIIEKDPELCKRASEILQDRAIVINSKYIEHSIFEDENIKKADVIITTSSEDEENIIKSLEAKEYGIKRCVAINNNIEYYDLMHKLGLIAIRGPKSSAYYSILEKIASSSIVEEKHYCGGRGTVLMRKIFPNSPLLFKKINPPKLPGLFFLLKKEQILPLVPKTILEKDDIIALFVPSTYEEEAKEWIYRL